MNILILAAGRTQFDVHDGSYPLCLTEFNGTPLIEKLITTCQAIGPVQFIVALREEDIQRFHLDHIVELLAPGTHILRISQDTQGAACTALLATPFIDNEQELLILNGDELLDEDIGKILADFHTRKLDAGAVTFPSVHPRYSYVRLNTDNLVVEAAEKNPISRHATVGFYWFAKGKNFVVAVKQMILKDASLNGLFYICPALNELVLMQSRIGAYPIQAEQYHPLKTERQLQQYEAAIDQRKN